VEIKSAIVQADQSSLGGRTQPVPNIAEQVGT
jgi:hypothetical protein